MFDKHIHYGIIGELFSMSHEHFPGRPFVIYAVLRASASYRRFSRVSLWSPPLCRRYSKEQDFIFIQHKNLHIDEADFADRGPQKMIWWFADCADSDAVKYSERTGQCRQKICFSSSWTKLSAVGFLWSLFVVIESRCWSCRQILDGVAVHLDLRLQCQISRTVAAVSRLSQLFHYAAIVLTAWGARYLILPGMVTILCQFYESTYS